MVMSVEFSHKWWTIHYVFSYPLWSDLCFVLFCYFKTYKHVSYWVFVQEYLSVFFDLFISSLVKFNLCMKLCIIYINNLKGINDTFMAFLYITCHRSFHKKSLLLSRNIIWFHWIFVSLRGCLTGYIQWSNKKDNPCVLGRFKLPHLSLLVYMINNGSKRNRVSKYLWHLRL